MIARGQGAGTVPTPYTYVSRTWGDPPKITAENKVTVSLRTVGSANLDAVRAGIDVTRDVVLAVDATADGVLRVAGAGGRVADVAVKAGQNTYTVAAGQLQAPAGAGAGGSGAPASGSLPATGALPAPMLALVLVAFAGVVMRRTRT